jgi:hypothetical protein
LEATVGVAQEQTLVVKDDERSERLVVVEAESSAAGEAGGPVDGDGDFFERELAALDEGSDERGWCCEGGDAGGPDGRKSGGIERGGRRARGAQEDECEEDGGSAF